MKIDVRFHNFFLKRAIFVLTAVFLVIIAWFGYQQYRLSQIDSFDKCAAAGLSVQESYPARCAVNGKTFTQTVTNPVVVPPVTTPSTPTTQKIIDEPISNSLSRITKKPFGIYISSATSPVQPEKFTGYHTGTDFETTAAEANITIPVRAVCDGTVRYKGTVEGYGGVVILNCTISGGDVTVLYGHIDIASATFANGDTVTKGDFVANLGAGYSAQTSGERKHLHLGIHKGSSIEYRGYVQNQSELAGWLNFQDLFK